MSNTAEEFLNEAKFTHLEHEDNGLAVTYPVVRIPDARKYAAQRLTTVKEKLEKLTQSKETYFAHPKSRAGYLELKEDILTLIEEELQ